MTIALPPWLAYGVTLAICALALWQGRWEERASAAGQLANIALTVVWRDHSWPAVQRGAFVADLLFFAFLLVIALRTTRYWPLAAAAFALLAVLTHLAKMIDPALQQWAYITAGVIWTYSILAAIGVGTWNSWRTRRQPTVMAVRDPGVATRR